MSQFEPGQRVIVAHSDWLELNGYYGHVASVVEDRTFPMVDVIFHGRVTRSADPAYVNGTPYPMFAYELEHPD